MAELDEVRAAFDRFDRCKDGTITVKEFGAALRSLPRFEDWDNCQVAEQVAVLDADGNGTIDFPEFCTVACQACWGSWMMGSFEDQMRHRLEHLFGALERAGGVQTLTAHACRQAMLLPCMRCGRDSLECPAWLEPSEGDDLEELFKRPPPAWKRPPSLFALWPAQTVWWHPLVLGTLDAAAEREADEAGVLADEAALSKLVRQQVDVVLCELADGDGRIASAALIDRLLSSSLSPGRGVT